MKRSLLLIFALASIKGYSQIDRVRNGAWVLSAINTKVNGIAGGLIIQKMSKDDPDSLALIINGLSVEAVGVGFFIPLAGSNPIYHEEMGVDYEAPGVLDSVLAYYRDKEYYHVNGIAVGGAGTGSHEIHVDGINVAGLCTLTGQVNGISAGGIFCNLSGRINGISVGGIFNLTLQTKGVQVGIFNESKRLRGFQIGVFNVNERRTLPFINWNFGRSTKKEAKYGSAFPARRSLMSSRVRPSPTRL